MAAEDPLNNLLERLTREFDAARAELSRAIDAERAEAATAAREAAESDRAVALAQAAQAAEERGRADGHDTGYQQGLDTGRDLGRQAGIEEGRAEGKKEGYDAGFSAGREAGMEAGRKAGREEGREEGRKEGRDEGRKEERAAAKQTGDVAASQRLTEAIRALDAARSLSEILDTLVTSAGREAARAALLFVRGDRLNGWRFVGFDSVDDNLQLAMTQSGVIADTVRSGATTTANGSQADSLPSFARRSGTAEHAEPAETNMISASSAVSFQGVAVPIRLAGEVIGVLYADSGAAEAAQEVHASWPATVEALTRYAARTIEAVTAFRAAKMFTEPAASTENDEAARRYARLLVSEIKMYHEAEVMAGRRERDLGTRLGGEIARARVLYEQRVPPQVRRGADHFHEELVRTLADGDASILKVKT
jgi:flagellar biosynthesis/type III secretory pathway protein FliH